MRLKPISAAAVGAVGMLSAAGRAQLPAGGWLVGGSEFVTYHDAAFTPVTSPSYWGATRSTGGGVAVDGDRMVYLTDTPGAVYRVSYNANLTPVRRLVVEAPGFVFPPTGLIPQIVVQGDRVWWAETTGNLWSLNKAITGQLATLHGSIWNMDPALHGTIQSLCTDGRELFFSTGLFYGVVGTPALLQSDIWAVDLRVPSGSRRHVASIPVDLWTSVCLGPDGDLLAMRTDGLRRIRPSIGSVSFVCPAPAHNHFLGQGAFVAYDPWQGKVAVGAIGTPDITHVQWKELAANDPWSLAYYFPFFSTLRKLASASEQPFEYFGSGCVNAINREPRMEWQGLPQQGQAFTMKVRDAEPNGFAMMWLGWSDAYWGPVGTLPYDASPLGAPGCRLLVAPDAPLPVFVDSSGRGSYSIPLPINTAIAGMRVFAQSVSTSGANSLGFAASDAVIIRMR